MDAALVRRAWQLGEIVHDVTYFAPETRAAGGAFGLPSGWMTYFGCRAAPLGAVSAATVAATFYHFAPAMVARSVPEVWRYATPEQLLHARLAAVDTALRRVLAGWGGGNGGLVGEVVTRLGRAAELAVRAAVAVEPAGRPLAAANAALPIPAAPHLALWQALTTLREHRGDGHVVLLVARGIGPVEALVLAAASGRAPAVLLRENRRWTGDEWREAERSLAARGWLDDSGALTPAGAAAREDLESATDELAAAPYRALGEDGVAELVAELWPVADRLVASGTVPVPNPVGVTWPPD
ncbi:MAG: hypothetical protein QOC93_1899 [Actinomycetota bacterium]|jgi:hypothetical protein|nr:hypothetical protein [Actinomycetota bacterium]